MARLDVEEITKWEIPTMDEKMRKKFNGGDRQR